MLRSGLRVLSVLLLVVAVLAPVSAWGGEPLSDLFHKVGITPLKRPKEAHDFVLPDIDGKEVRLKELRGKIVVLNIWAMWCAPCREEMPFLERLHQHFMGQDLVILAVSTDLADIRLLKTFIEKQGYTFTVVHDPRGNIMEWFRTVHIPVTYLIDRSGKVVGKAVGPRDWNHEDMIRVFDELLKQCSKNP